MTAIGIILDCDPYWGGSFQYARSLFEAVYRFAENESFRVIAFYKQPGWLDFLGRYEVACINISGNFIGDIITIDSENCVFVVGTAQVGWSARLATPVVEPIHDLMHRYEPRFPEVSQDGIWEDRELMFSSMVRNACGILVDSNEGSRQVKESYGYCFENKVYVLPFSAPEYLSEMGEPVELPFNKYFFYPAQFWAHKNHINLIRAIAKLRDKGVKVNFVFVGSQKNGYDEVVALIEEYHLSDQVLILGYVPDSKMRFLYEHARALVMPSFLGPTNIPPIEAVTLGCPVAVSNVYGMPEQLGDAALYFDPADPDEIASVLFELWDGESLCQELIEKGKKIADRFSQETFNKNFCPIGKSIMDSIARENKLFDSLLLFCSDHKRLYIYGAGEFAYKISRILEHNHVFYDTIVVSSLSGNQEARGIFNKEIKDISEIHFNEQDGMICAISEKYRQEVVDILHQNNVDDPNVYMVDGSWLHQAFYEISGL